MGIKMIIEDEIFVLKEVRYNDNDKILHALSKNNGKIQIVSRGWKKTKVLLLIFHKLCPIQNVNCM